MIQAWYTSNFENQEWSALSSQFNDKLMEIEYKLEELISIKEVLCSVIEVELQKLKAKEDELDDNISYYEELIKEEV